jgi:hypothetical protein
MSPTQCFISESNGGMKIESGFEIFTKGCTAQIQMRNFIETCSVL